MADPDLSKADLTLLHHGELMKISKNRAQARMFYLFPECLAYCKRDKAQLVIKGVLALKDIHHTGAEACSACMARCVLV
jgi:hypothetical protein